MFVRQGNKFVEVFEIVLRKKKLFLFAIDFFKVHGP